MTTKRALENFAVNTYLYRKKLKMSKYRLSKITGLCPATITGIENGSRQPGLQTALEICKKLDKPIEIMIDDPRI